MLDRKTATQLSEQATQLLSKAFLNKAIVTQKSGRFDKNTLTITFNITPGVKGDVESGARKAFEQNAKLLGLKPECYGKTVMVKGKKYKVTGLNLRKPKFPVESVCVETKRRVNLTRGALVRFDEAKPAVGHTKWCEYCGERPVGINKHSCINEKCLRKHQKHTL